MIKIVEKILGNDFVSYDKVYKLATLQGMSRKEVKKVKLQLGVKTITLVNGDERMWLWYIPKNIWKKYCVKE